MPGDFAVCWACGAASDGTPDPDFPRADALVIERDPDQPRPVWWPAFCVVLFPMAVYEVLDSVFPDRAASPGRARRRTTYAAVDRRLIRACLLAVFAVSWFPPLAFLSLWLLWGVDYGIGVQAVRTKRLLWKALALNLLYSIPCMVFFPAAIVPW